MKLIIIPGLDIELCGSWLWIGGNTREHKEELKALSCRWSKNKKLWYWHHAEEGRKWRRGTYSMNEIRTKYGSQTFKGPVSYTHLPSVISSLSILPGVAPGVLLE